MNRTLLNNVDHHDLRVIARFDAAYGDAVNQAVIFPTEFEEAQRDYPILFRRDPQGALVPVVLLGLDADENLFLDEAGWHARYVPAVQQRGPFSIGLPRPEADGDRPGEPMIHVDLDDPRVGRAAGEPLFLRHGGNAPHLERIAAVLRAIHVGREVMAPMFAAFEAAGLVEPVSLKLQVDEGRRYELSGFFTIPAERLAALDGPSLARLHEGGFLRAAFAVAFSFGNIGRIIALKAERREAERAATEAAA